MAMFAIIFYVVFLCCLMEVTSEEDCLLDYDDLCITLHLEPSSYDNAEKECKRLNGLLLIPNSEHKQNQLLKALMESTSDRSFWIGLSDRQFESRWTYSNGLELGGFINWEKNEPNGGTIENCLQLYITGKWNDVNCSIRLAFICERLHQKQFCNYNYLSIPNAFFQNCHQSILLPHGETLSFNCQDGYASEINTVTCDDGNWKTDGKCIPSCPPPVVPSNMRLLSDKTIYYLKEKVDLVCKDGLFLKENQPIAIQSLTCIGVNKWSSIDLPCVALNHFLMLNPGDFRDSITIEFTDEDSLILNCSTDEQDNSLNFNFKWSKDAFELKPAFFSSFNFSITEIGQLQLLNISKYNAGIYICIKYKINTNEIQQITTYKLRRLTEKCFLANHTTYVELIEKESKILRCSNFWEHFSYFSWAKDNHEIGYDDQKYLVLQDGSLLLKRIDHDSAGKYTCKVTQIRTSCTSYHLYVVSVKPTFNSVCGKTSSGNTDVHPWFVSLWWDDEEKPFGYGVVVSDQWIVSAASCLANIRRRMYPHIYIQFGFNENVTLDESSHLSSVDLIVIHPMYSKRLLVNDIGLIKLSKPLPLKEGAGILCLMSKEIQNKLTYQRKCDLPKNIIGNVPGMGPLESREYIPNTEMMNVAPNDQCHHLVELSSAESMFCAEPVNKDFIKLAGDTGSPFVVEMNGRFYLYGIYSWGERISNVGKYDYFTKVSIFYSWIISKIK